MDETWPSVSVVIRSYNRMAACLELIRVILDQDYVDFEVVVIEQSTDITPEQRKQIEQREAGDPRLRVLRYTPLGPAGARNEGWRQARGEIILFIDDDDLPMGRDWIAKHARHFSDPDILGVSGREVLRVDEQCGYAHRAQAVRRCLSYNFFGYPHVYCRLDERVDPVDWLHGGNASIRRSVIQAVGGWDETLVDHEEHSFAFKLDRIRSGGARLIFDPAPVILRRKELPGGLDRRTRSPRAVFFRYFDYFHRVIGRYRPIRLVLLYPAYLALIEGATIRWIWKDSQTHRRLTSKLLASGYALLAFPLWLVGGYFGLLKGRRPGFRQVESRDRGGNRS